jgi:hypothetical protein
VESRSVIACLVVALLVVSMQSGRLLLYCSHLVQHYSGLQWRWVHRQAGRAGHRAAVKPRDPPVAANGARAAQYKQLTGAVVGDG